MSPNPAQLFLLADHIKLSLLERQRAISLDLEPNAQDGQISRSLDSLQQGIEALESQSQQWDDPLHPSEEQSATAEQLRRLKQQHAELSSEFRTSSGSGPTPATLSTPNDASPGDASARSSRRPGGGHAALPPPDGKRHSKSVRFTDAGSRASPPDPHRAALFPSDYTDEPGDGEAAGDQSALSNADIHAYHRQVLQQQDDQLDALGQSIGRQRELSIQIGDELDGQVALLDDVDEHVDRHQGQLDRARNRLGRFSRKAKENWGLSTIVVLIIVLVLLIVITKR